MEIEIEKPSTDHREYKPLQLENGIQVMLVSDAKCDKAAAALSVKVGSLFDPSSVPGLAHFCEHMLFLGTKKYPKEDEYNEFLAKHAGMSNAYTAETVTNFYFGVSPSHLEGALDRFAQFFLEPLFTETATERELKAVESEHSKNQQSDSWRALQLLRNDANPKHPMCHFATGNVETLQTIPEEMGYPVRDSLMAFHKQYYSANLMCLAVLGKESLAELETLVSSLFGAVVNKNASVPEGPAIGGAEPTFVTEGWPRMVRSVPVRDVRRLSFQFVLPQQMPEKWRSKPTSYLGFTIGHEGEGSILSALKAEGLATELSAGPMMDEAGACIFEVMVQLTEKGEGNEKRVGELLFTYIRLLQEVPVSHDLYHETKCVQEMNFRFRGLPDPISTVSSLSHSMQNGLPIDKVFSGPSKMWELNEEHITEAAKCLCCASLRVFLSTKKQAEEESACPETERWYGTKYGISTLVTEWKEAWELCRLGDGTADAITAGKAVGLALPTPNPFVPENLDLKPRPECNPAKPQRVETLKEHVVAKLNSRLPCPMPMTRAIQVYFRQDTSFDLPKACLYLEFFSPWTSESLANRTATGAWCRAVSEELQELSYHADVAGLTYSLGGSSKGISIALSGYQDKFPVLLGMVAAKMASLEEVSEQMFDLIYSVMLRNSTNATKNKTPYQQGAEWLSRCFQKRAFTSGEILDEVKKLRREDLSGVGQKALKSVYVEGLLQGNYTEAEVTDVVEPLLPILQPEVLLEAVPEGATARLPCDPGSSILFCADGTNLEEKNGAVFLSLQAARDSMATVTFVELTAQILGQRCFNELRTQQQLGYIVSMQPYSDQFDGGFCGVRVIVQSEKHPAELHRRVESWLQPALAELLDTTSLADEKLQEYVDALLTLKKEKPKTLQDEFSRNSVEVTTRRFRFTRREEGIAFLERPIAELSQEFRTFVKEHLIPARRFCAEIRGATARGLASDDQDAAPFEDRVAARLHTLEDVLALRERLTWISTITAIPA